MEYRILGKTGLKVSVIGLGCAELGMDYGINIPGEYGKPDRNTSRLILNKALDLGINLFDTAPGYGDSETLLGDILGSKNCYFATKVSIIQGDVNAALNVRCSIEKSLKNLRRECLDIVQIHNTMPDTPKKADVVEVLLDLKKKGMIRFIGDSVYGPRSAMMAIKRDTFDVLQVAYSILDQRMSETVFPEAQRKMLGVIGRAPYFRGILTEKVVHLNDNFDFLKKTVKGVKDEAGINTWDDLTESALRFCLSAKELGSVLVGVRTLEELKFAVETEKKGALPDNIFEALSIAGIKDDYWVDPLNWYLKL